MLQTIIVVVIFMLGALCLGSSVVAREKYQVPFFVAGGLLLYVAGLLAGKI